MPGFYPEDEYDLAGFTVGAVEKTKILDVNTMKAGDAIIALPSTGVHSNGFSLVRRVFDLENKGLDRYSAELGRTLGEALLEPTKIYVKPALAAINAVPVRAISHITGGGFYENIPRALADGCCARIDKASLKVLPIFDLIQKVGNIPERDMFNTFNMGVGMAVIVDGAHADEAMRVFKANGQDAYIMGEIVSGEKGVEVC